MAGTEIISITELLMVAVAVAKAPRVKGAKPIRGVIATPKEPAATALRALLKNFSHAALSSPSISAFSLQASVLIKSSKAVWLALAV